MLNRHFKIKRLDMVDTFLLLLMYLQLVILEFFGLGRTLNKIVTVLILLRLVLMKGSQIKNVLRIGVALTVLFFLSFLFGEVRNLEIAGSNFLMIVYPFVYVYYITFLCKNRAQFINSTIKSAFWLFNATIILNIYVIYQQIVNPYSFRAVVVGDEIAYYADLISGLFAYASVHTFCLFSIFVILYNFSYRQTLKHNAQRVLFVWNIILIVIILAISLANENKAGFILLPLCILLYWFSGSEKKSKRLNRVVVTVCLGPILVFMLYTFVPAVKEFIDHNVLKLLVMMQTSLHIGSSALGSNERIAIMGYALGNMKTWLTGTGFGSASYYQSGYQGFMHFGQADFGSILILGGVWFLILMIMAYQRMFMRIVGVPKNKMLQLGVTIILIITVVYTQCFTRVNIATSLVLIMLAFKLRFQQAEKEKS